MAGFDEAIILFNRVTDQSPEDVKDVKAQAEWIAEELEALGFKTRMLPFGLDCARELAEAKKRGGCFVLNMVDAAPGEEGNVILAPATLEAIGIPFAGCGAEALTVTNNKLLTKRLLLSYGLPTPAWLDGDGAFEPGLYLIKPVTEDASVGLDDQALVTSSSREELRTLTAAREARLNKRCFAEKYIDGREFNVCVYGGVGNPVVLPPYEWVFPGFLEAGKPRFINYDAKWTEHTFEYDALAAVYHLPPEDEPLTRELIRLAEACWRGFQLNGWARVDFRIDGNGKPWILEINANPSFYGFFNIARAYGFPFSRVVMGVAEALSAKGCIS